MKTPLWKLEPHSLGKHLVLRRYLDAWFPIMSSWNGRILFIDGFAGPGEYEGGEEGSPIIAMKSLIEHRSRKMVTSEVGFLFIEKEKDRAAHLERLVKNLKHNLPRNCRVRVVNSSFNEELTEVLDQLDGQVTILNLVGVSENPASTNTTKDERVSW